MNSSKLEFTYKFENGDELYKKLPFRPGDLVEVADWGENYSNFTTAFNAFGFGEQKLHGFNTNRQAIANRPHVLKFVAALEHCQYKGCIICHVRSMQGHNFVIGIEGLKPVKVYPLRKLKGETTTVEIKRLLK
jgi:hypothetical protein